MSSRRTIDGEFDPMTAAANRRAAERRAREARERVRLQNEAAAAKKRAEAARIAEIKKKQAETAATLERTRLSAQKRAQERAAKKPKPTIPKPTIPRVGAGARGKDTKPGRIMGGPAGIDPSVTKKIALNDLLNGWLATNEKMRAKGGFLTEKENADWLKEIQENPYLAYDKMTVSGGISGAKPKTLDEALNTLGHTISTIALGGGRDYTFPFSLKAGQPTRVHDALLQTIGALIVFSPADLLVSKSIKAMMDLGKKGSKIVRKVAQGVDLTADEARQFEKEIGQYGYSTADLRKALGSKAGKLTQAEWDEFWIKYGKLNVYSRTRSAGAGYTPTATQEFAEIMDDIGYDLDEYIDYLKTYKLEPTLDPATIAAFLLGMKPPKPDLKAYQKIENDLDKYRESLKQKLKEAQEEAVITGPVSRTELKPKEPQKPGYTPPSEVTKEEEKGGTLLGYTPKPDVKEEAPPSPKPAPPKPVQIQKAATTTQIQEEEVETVTPDAVPSDMPIPAKPRGKDGRMRPNVFRALVGGLKEKYRVIFNYPKGKIESFTVTARSFPQALSQATQLRRVKYVPSEVDVAKVGK